MRVIIDTSRITLSPTERQTLTNIAARMRALPSQQVPDGYERELDRVFGSDCDPETNRWER